MSKSKWNISDEAAALADAQRKAHAKKAERSSAPATREELCERDDVYAEAINIAELMKSDLGVKAQSILDMVFDSTGEAVMDGYFNALGFEGASEENIMKLTEAQAREVKGLIDEIENALFLSAGFEFAKRRFKDQDIKLAEYNAGQFCQAMESVMAYGWSYARWQAGLGENGMDALVKSLAEKYGDDPTKYTKEQVKAAKAEVDRALAEAGV